MTTAYPQLKPKGQCERILQLLREHPEGVTASQIVAVTGAMQYNARIYTLRKLGHTIEAIPEASVENGTACRFVLREQSADDKVRCAMLGWGR